MRIIWKNETKQNYIFRQQAAWTGVKVHRAQIMPGRMLEHTPALHEINVTISGKLITEKSSAGGKRITTKAGAGNICLTPAGQPVGAHWGKPIDNMGILLEPNFVVQTAVENQFSPKFDLVEIYKDKDLLVQQIGLALLAESEAENPAGRLYIESLTQTFVLHLLRNYSTAKYTAENIGGGLSGYKLRRVKEFIRASLEEDLNLADIAAVADLSQYHFARSFRKSTGFTPQQYLMRERLERAKELLANEHLPLVEVSLQTGFKNQSHFTTLFRKYTKFTPKLWRELKLA